MTRINVVPPIELCDQHLRAEYRELPRILTKVKQGWHPATIPAEYTLGAGHVKFFAFRVAYLLRRHQALRAEMQRRGMRCDIELHDEDVPNCRLHGYEPTPEAIEANKRRIAERISTFIRPARWTNTNIPEWVKNEQYLDGSRNGR